MLQNKCIINIIHKLFIQQDINIKGKESTYRQDRRLMQREIDYLRSQFNLDGGSSGGLPATIANPSSGVHQTDHLDPLYPDPITLGAAGSSDIVNMGDFKLATKQQQQQSKMAAVSGIKSDTIKSQLDSPTLTEDLEDIEDEFEKASSIERVME